jgi:hypothetical protein
MDWIHLAQDMTMNRQWALVNMLINPEFDKGQGICW